MQYIAGEPLEAGEMVATGEDGRIYRIRSESPLFASPFDIEKGDMLEFIKRPDGTHVTLRKAFGGPTQSQLIPPAL